MKRKNLFGITENQRVLPHNQGWCRHPQNPESGIALILVMFIVGLATILVVHLTNATYLSSRASAYVQRSIEAEYYLKSMITLARSLIRNDGTPEDSSRDTWGKFMNGVELPSAAVGLQDKAVKLSLQIRPADAKIRITNVVSPSGQVGPPEQVWQEVTLRLFKSLGFDTDAQEDQSGLFPKRVFTAPELLANLVDYMDDNSDPFADPNYPPGIEDQVPKDAFRNEPIKHLNELRAIPGFTELRIQKLLPYITTYGQGQVNINMAPKLVLQSLHQDIDDQLAQQVIDYRVSDNGPFTTVQRITQMQQVFGSTIAGAIDSYTTVASDWFEIIAKVEYSTSSYFARAYVESTQQAYFPDVKYFELY